MKRCDKLIKKQCEKSTKRDYHRGQKYTSFLRHAEMIPPSPQNTSTKELASRRSEAGLIYLRLFRLHFEGGILLRNRARLIHSLCTLSVCSPHGTKPEFPYAAYITTFDVYRRRANCVSDSVLPLCISRIRRSASLSASMIGSPTLRLDRTAASIPRSIQNARWYTIRTIRKRTRTVLVPKGPFSFRGGGTDL